MDRIAKLHQLGQSLWYDNIERRLLDDGSLERMISREEIRGITSNPSIFHSAISKTHQYDAAIMPMAFAGWKPDSIFWQLAVEDICRAADLFLPLYEKSNGSDGYVSLEVSPKVANDTDTTVREAKRLWQWVARPNLMIKIPATKAGIPAIRKAIALGINVNVTLVFSLARYAEVMDAYLAGLEDRMSAKKPLSHIASVASFFVSRVDSKVDPLLHSIGTQAALALQGKTAIANVQLAYELFGKTFEGSRFARLEAAGAHVQRPLWASTSTKNPAYRDVLYVEKLIAPQTVNTVPPATLDAFRDHGEAAIELSRADDKASRHMSELMKLGISIDQVTADLEVEGVTAFARAFEEMLASIDARRKEFCVSLGSLKKSVADRIKSLDEDQVIRRIYAHDASLWTDDIQGQSEIQKRLGWLGAPQTALNGIEQAEALAAEVQREGYTQVILLGMGGSSLAPEVYRLTFGVGQINNGAALELAILDSTDPQQVRAAERLAPLEKTLFIVASKSGGTSEINAFLNYFWHKAEKRLGKKAGSHFIAITDPGTVLEHLARERGFRRVVLSDPSVGGRYSALTPFGLIPAALIGINLRQLLSNAIRMWNECQPDIPSARNPALVLGVIMAEATLAGMDKMTILADPDLESFGSWMEQLIAESSGKQGKGIIPIDIEPLGPVRRLSLDRWFVYLRHSGHHDDRIRQLRRSKRPVVVLDIPGVYDLGAEFFRWEFGTAVACAILKVNGFDQPDVQDNKTRTEANILNFQKAGRLDEGTPIWSKSGISVFGSRFDDIESALTITDLVKMFISTGQPGDYVALNAYLPRNPATQKRLQRIRRKIIDSSGYATTLGFGPRFLHSTGQLHKGGPNTGLFIQITSDPELDMEIPNHGLTFGTLERAQALGDLQALLARGRRVIRINLKPTDLDKLI